MLYSIPGPGLIGQCRQECSSTSKGQRQIVLQLLARRFGELSPETEERVARAEVDELQRWALRLLDAGSLDDVFESA